VSDLRVLQYVGSGPAADRRAAFERAVVERLARYLCQPFVLNARTASAKHPFAETLAREPWELAVLSENQAVDADFHPLAETDLVLIVRGGLEINSLEYAERLGAQIAVNAGYPADRILSRRVPILLLVRVTESDEEIELLHSEHADVLAYARYHAQRLVDREPAWRIAPRPFGTTAMGSRRDRVPQLVSRREFSSR
jgi:hypothetical protein